jgi:hypothetical protein
VELYLHSPNMPHGLSSGKTLPLPLISEGLNIVKDHIFLPLSLYVLCTRSTVPITPSFIWKFETTCSSVTVLIRINFQTFLITESNFCPFTFK